MYDQQQHTQRNNSIKRRIFPINYEMKCQLKDFQSEIP